MTTATFDTHAAVRAMEQAGLEAVQAEAITDTIRSALSGAVATKSDIAELRSELRADMASLETRMTRTLYGVAAALLAGQLAAVLALLRLLG